MFFFQPSVKKDSASPASQHSHTFNESLFNDRTRIASLQRYRWFHIRLSVGFRLGGLLSSRTQRTTAFRPTCMWTQAQKVVRHGSAIGLSGQSWGSRNRLEVGQSKKLDGALPKGGFEPYAAVLSIAAIPTVRELRVSAGLCYTLPTGQPIHWCQKRGDKCQNHITVDAIM